MKTMNSLLLGLLFVGTAAAQMASSSSAPSSSQAVPSAVDAPGVIVTQNKWQKEVYVPALYEDPMRPNQDAAALLQEQKETLRANAVRVKEGFEPKPLPTRAAAADGNAHLPSSVNYVYGVRIKNTGTKTIKVIVWQYSFFDPETAVEIGHHRFTSNTDIRSGKTANLLQRSSSPPTHVVVATKAGKDPRGNYSERVSIDRLEYEDGTSWQRPPD